MEIRESLLSTGLINLDELNRYVRFIEATETTWRKTIIEQVLSSDIIVIRFTPKSLDFPNLVVPSPMRDINYFEYYKLPHQEIQTGAGLLSEVAYCNRLDALQKSILLVNEWQIDELEDVIRLTSLGTGDIFTFNETSPMIPKRPRFTSLDFQITSLRNVRSALAFPRRDLLFSNLEYIDTAAAALRGRMIEIFNSSFPKQSLEMRFNQGFLDYGVSDKPKKVFPDYELKVIKHTPVEKLLAMSPGELIEVDFNAVVQDHELELNSAICPYCQAQRDYLFFYQYGHTTSKTAPVRCKCQFCTRRSTVDGGILMDQ